MQDFKKIKVWEKAHSLTLSIYNITKEFPKTEMFGLTNQIRRSCISIPANIAEGCCRGSRADFSRFLQISMGSASELEYHLLLSRDLNFISVSIYEQLTNQTEEIKKMLSSFIKKLKTDD
jgi:four helix bundle protein